MGRSSHNTDANGWTWIFRKNKDNITKPIGNPFQKDLEKVASSFYVTNFQESINAKELWKTFMPYARLADTFITNKRSKRVAKYQRQNSIDTNMRLDVPISKQQNHNPKPTPTYTNIHLGKPYFASVVHGSSSTSDSPTPTNIRSISLKEQDL
ncbi:hypothetical protein Tco_0177183, partial [Tanacetum coccineum]